MIVSANPDRNSYPHQEQSLARIQVRIEGTMTAVEKRIKLQRTLKHSEIEALNCLSTVYGIQKLLVDKQEILVEFDATRMNGAEVLSLLRAAGLPADPTK